MKKNRRELAPAKYTGRYTMKIHQKYIHNLVDRHRANFNLHNVMDRCLQAVISELTDTVTVYIAIHLVL